MVNSRRRHVSWSNLPGKIIHKISKQLKTRDQILGFKLVCRKWRKRSIHLPVNILSLTLPLSNPISTTCNNTPPFHVPDRPLVLQVSSIYLIIPSQPSPFSSVFLKPWMIMVQEPNPGKLQLRHPLTMKPVNKIPHTLDLSQFQVTKLSHGYNFKYSDCAHKVVMCSPTSSSSLEFLVLYREGSLGKLTLMVKFNQDQNTETDDDRGYADEEEARWCWKNVKVSQNKFRYVDDIVEFKDKHCVVDRRGKLYLLDTEAMTVASVLISEPISLGKLNSNRRKRLVVDSTSRELHLVVREHVNEKSSFKVYKYNEQCKKWDVLEHLGRERVLFIGVDHSFFAKSKDFPGCKGNCIVFSAYCFTQYSGRDNPDDTLFGDVDVEVGVYRIGRGDNFRLLSSAYPEFSEMIWPPPTWFPSASERSDEDRKRGSFIQEKSDGQISSSIKSLSDDHAEKMLTDSSGESSCSSDEEMQLDTSDHDSNGTTNSEEDEDEETQTNSFNGNDTEPNFSDKVRFASIPFAQQPAMKNEFFTGPPLAIEYEEPDMRTSKMNNQKNGGDLGHDFFEEKVVFSAKSTQVIPTVLPLASEKCSSIIKFQGIDIKSELLPTLETIWAKHGSLICENTIRSKELLACALELVAKLMIRLQNTTGRSLTETQVGEMRSNLIDLQRIGLKMDWLVSTVEKAVKLHESKPLIESIMLLEKEKARVDEEEKEFLARSAKVKQELDDDMACLSSRIPFPDIIDLDDCLGGLL